jgi:hypothetical protein
VSHDEGWGKAVGLYGLTLVERSIDNAKRSGRQARLELFHIDPILYGSAVAGLTHESQADRGRIQRIERGRIGQNAVAPLELVDRRRQGRSPGQLERTAGRYHGRPNRRELTGLAKALALPLVLGQFDFLVVGEDQPTRRASRFLERATTCQGGYQLDTPIAIGVEFLDIVKVVKLRLGPVAAEEGRKVNFRP